MALYKISIALLGTLTSLVAGDFRYEHFKTFSFDGADSIRKPWFVDSYASGSPYRSESTQLVPHYASYPYDTLKHGTDPIPSIISSGVKKIPNEDKSFKKAISPFYSLSDTDDPKFKEIILKSGAPYCQEITAKDTKAGAAASPTDEKQMTCYRCKDPKNGSIYEHCSYTSRPQSNTRGPRSNAAAEKTIDTLTSASNSRHAKSSAPPSSSLPEAFRFSDDYFHPEATHELPAEYEKNIDNCERVVKDSMVCMVCKDPKTSGKYEQCSYVAQPNEKAFAYTKSSSFGGGAGKPKPRDEALKEVVKKTRKVPDHHEEEEPERIPEADHHDYHHEEPEERYETQGSEHSDEESAEDKDKEGHGTHYVPDHTYHYPTYKDYTRGSYGNYGADEEEEEAAPSHSVKSSNNCKTVHKNGESCTVCTDPTTGGKSENCAYAHEPKDKVYKYSKSKSFGYPESKSSSGGGGSHEDHDHEKTAEPSEKQERESSGEDYLGSYASEPSTLDYIKSESEKISQKVKGKGDCRKVTKDSMVCTICKDPKTGGDFEQCNYSYDPEDKVYAYSKSKSFGSPTKTSSDDYSGSGEEHPEETYSAPIIYPTGTSPLDYIPKSSESQVSSIYTTKRPQGESQEKPVGSKVDTGFYDATVRRAEIEKIVKDIGAEDRSKCKKMFKAGMTCYKCTDDKGFTNEECVYVTDPESEASKKITNHAITEAATTVEVTAKPTERTTTTTTTTSLPTAAKLLEPLASSSWDSVIAKRKTRETKKEKPKDKDEELPVLDEERDEAEPYDYVAETRPVYDKVLGLSLPAYMIQKSPHEVEFDEFVENSKF